MSFTKDRSVYLTVRASGDDGRPAGWGASGYLAGATYKATRIRTGDNNPNWRTQVKRQEDATTNMTGTFTKREAQTARAEMDYNFDLGFGHFQKCHASLFGDLGILGGPPDWAYNLPTDIADNRARNAFFKNVRKALIQFSAPTFIGELKESLHMIRHPAEGLQLLSKNWLLRTAKERKKYPKEWKRHLSSMWLEGAFGWNPLISDCNDAFKAFKGLTGAKPQIPVSGFGIETKEVPSRMFTNIDVPHGWCHYLYNQRAYNKAFVKYKGMVTRTMTDSGVSKLEPFGLNFEEFVPTAWELLPWSFLIDYFSNVGDVIAAGVTSLTHLAWVNKSTVTSRYAIRDSWFSRTSGGVYSNLISASGTNGHDVWESRDVSRAAGVPIERPHLSFEIPGSPAQWANMTALFAQANAIHPQDLHKLSRGRPRF